METKMEKTCDIDCSRSRDMQAVKQHLRVRAWA